LFLRTNTLGKFLFEQAENGASVTLITRPVVSSEELKAYEDVEASGVNVYFLDQLHSKLYFFKVDTDQLRFGQKHEDAVVIGSANLTVEGIVPPQEQGLEELCLRLGLEAVPTLDSYILELMDRSADIPKMRVRLTRIKGNLNARR
jgi:hypothetical protein